jgi:hypothetical protein
MIGRVARLRPLPLAITFALASAPVVAGTLLLGSSSFPFPSVASVVRPEDGLTALHAARPGIVAALGVALVAVLASAVAGTWAGGRAYDRGRTAGVVAAVAAAWAIGISVLPFAAWLFHVPLRPVSDCDPSCPGWLVDPAPWSGLVAYGRSIPYGVIAWPGVVLAAFLAVAASARKQLLLTTIAALGIYGAIHIWSVAQAPLPFAALVLGTLAWDELLARRAASAG